MLIYLCAPDGTLQGENTVATCPFHWHSTMLKRTHGGIGSVIVILVVVAAFVSFNLETYQNMNMNWTEHSHNSMKGRLLTSKKRNDELYGKAHTFSCIKMCGRDCLIDLIKISRYITVGHTDPFLIQIVNSPWL